MDDDWETDPDYVNDVSEKEQRWGSKSVPGSGRMGHININQLREDTMQNDSNIKSEHGPKMSYGYGGKFQVEKDRMDKTAVGHDHIEKPEKHSSQKDYAEGFGGKFGVQSDRQDKSALDYSYKHESEKHSSQKDYSKGFGGQYGVEKDRQDQSAVGFDHKENVDKHSSQKDYSYGFGGKFGVQKDRKDSSAHDYNESSVENKLHDSQAPVIPDKPADLKSIRAIFENNNNSKYAISEETNRMSKLRVQEDMKKANEERKILLESEQSKTTEDNNVVKEEEVKEEDNSNSDTATKIEDSVSVDKANGKSDQSLPKAVALYDYTADEEDEITFSVGENITEIEKISDGWWKGVCRDKCGLFPANYVEEVLK